MKRKNTSRSRSSLKRCKSENEGDQVECQACTEPADINLPNCDHSYCKDCFTQSFKTAIETTSFTDKICCEPLPHSLIKDTLPPALFDQYTAEKEVLKQLKRTCFSCQQDVLIPIENEGFFTCACSAVMCIHCNKEKHDGECTDSETDKTLKQLAKESGWSKCPRCAFLVEKIKGCCYMKCKCNAEFCNRCSRAWKKSEGELAHRRHRCYYCSQVVMGFEFEEDDEGRDYKYRVVGIRDAVPNMSDESVRNFLEKADDWVQKFVPKKGNYKKDVPIHGFIMRKTELKILPGSKPINAATIDRVREELKRVREDHTDSEE